MRVRAGPDLECYVSDSSETRRCSVILDLKLRELRESRNSGG